MKKIGYWRDKEDKKTSIEKDLPYPTEFIDKDWNKKERQVIIDYLKKGEVVERWKGYSTCRICEKYNNGSRCLGDGQYQWPEGYAHYIETHDVKPPQEFIEWVLKGEMK